MPARQQDGAFLDQSLKFAKSDRAPGEGDSADQRSARRRQRELEIYLFDKSSPKGFFQGGPHRQRRGAASEAVEDGDHLRDRGHGGAVGHDRSDQGPYHYASYDDFEADDALIQKGNHNRQEHARRPQQVAPHRRAGMGQSLEAEDKKDCRDQIEKVDEFS